MSAYLSRWKYPTPD